MTKPVATKLQQMISSPCVIFPSVSQLSFSSVEVILRSTSYGCKSVVELCDMPQLVPNTLMNLAPYLKFALGCYTHHVGKFCPVQRETGQVRRTHILLNTIRSVFTARTQATESIIGYKIWLKTLYAISVSSPPSHGLILILFMAIGRFGIP